MAKISIFISQLKKKDFQQDLNKYLFKIIPYDKQPLELYHF